MTSPKVEPSRKVIACVYCGDAPIHHGLFLFSSLISMFVDEHIMKVTKHAPDFMKDLVDWLLFSFFDIFLFLHLAHLSDDINKARTFRSRVIWEEAKRRGIDMKQLIMFGKATDQYQVLLQGKNVYFNSLPIPMKELNMTQNWDDKFVLKQEFIKNNIPVPEYVQFNIFGLHNVEKIFSKFKTPIIVKPRVGSRGRHTVTNIRTLPEFKTGINVAKQICGELVAEEHLEGDVCRATLVKGKLMGFYRGATPFVVGDGKKTVTELINEKDSTRPERVQKVLVNEELENYVLRSGFKMGEVVPAGVRLKLTHRTGRFFGGITKEMLDELHPSFVPILEEAAKVVNLPVMGFDCIVPDPTQDASAQKWGIIECNTLPFIDLHYYALEGKPKNIAGAIWDMWQ
jgi:D-alanine-D-alanine ligase-like ATP-grasp enzyme